MKEKHSKPPDGWTLWESDYLAKGGETIIGLGFFKRNTDNTSDALLKELYSEPINTSKLMRCLIKEGVIKKNKAKKSLRNYPYIFVDLVSVKRTPKSEN